MLEPIEVWCLVIGQNWQTPFWKKKRKKSGRWPSRSFKTTTSRLLLFLHLSYLLSSLRSHDLPLSRHSFTDGSRVFICVLSNLLLRRLRLFSICSCSIRLVAKFPSYFFPSTPEFVISSLSRRCRHKNWETKRYDVVYSLRPLEVDPSADHRPTLRHTFMAPLRQGLYGHRGLSSPGLRVPTAGHPNVDDETDRNHDWHVLRCNIWGERTYAESPGVQTERSLHDPQLLPYEH